jgi:hypothetical protein
MQGLEKTDTHEPAPLTEREMNQFVTLSTLPTLERALDRLRWLEAELAALKKAKTRRKVVQLIVLPKKDHYLNELYALADDGTIWQRYEPEGWLQSLDIPQPSKDPKP